jgi:hypothetical protein
LTRIGKMQPGVSPSSLRFCMEDSIWGRSNRCLGRYFLATEEEARHAFSERYGDDVSWLWNDHAGGYVVG